MLAKLSSSVLVAVAVAVAAGATHSARSCGRIDRCVACLCQGVAKVIEIVAAAAAG